MKQIGTGRTEWKKCTLVDLNRFSDIQDQGSIPMCASVTVADLIAFYVSVYFEERVQIDARLMHSLIEESNHSSRSKRLDCALQLWKDGIIPSSVLNDNVPLTAITPNNIECHDSRSPTFITEIRDELISGRPVILDVPLMLSSIGALSTGLFPTPHSVEGDMRISRHIVLIVGSCAVGSMSQNAWVIRNCWGRNWGEGGLGLVPYKMTNSTELLKATFVRPKVGF